MMHSVQTTQTIQWFNAARNGDVETLSSLFKQRVWIDRPDARGRSALYLAAKNGHISSVSFLLKRGAKIYPNLNGKTVFKVAENQVYTFINNSKTYDTKVYSLKKILEGRLMCPNQEYEILLQKAQQLEGRIRFLGFSILARFVVLKSEKNAIACIEQIPKEIEQNQSPLKYSTIASIIKRLLNCGAFVSALRFIQMLPPGSNEKYFYLRKMELTAVLIDEFDKKKSREAFHRILFDFNIGKFVSDELLYIIIKSVSLKDAIHRVLQFKEGKEREQACVFFSKILENEQIPRLSDERAQEILSEEKTYLYQSVNHQEFRNLSFFEKIPPFFQTAYQAVFSYAIVVEGCKRQDNDLISKGEEVIHSLPDEVELLDGLMVPTEKKDFLLKMQKCMKSHGQPFFNDFKS